MEDYIVIYAVVPKHIYETKLLTPEEKSYIKGKINNNVFHLEIDDGNSEKNVIEIHLKNPLENDLTLVKGTENV